MSGAARRWPATTMAVAVLVASAGACTKESGSEAEFCGALKRTPALETVVQGFVNTEPSALDARLDDADEAFDALLEASPAEVRGSVREMNGLVDAVIEAVRRHPDDPEAAASELRQAVLEHRGGAAGAAKVAVYAKAHCDIDLGPATDEGPTTTEP